MTQSQDTNELIVLIGENNHDIIGTAEKYEAHKKGLKHRAFSVFIMNSKGEMLLQQRAFEKYHSGGCWSNACCSHPRPHEINAIATAAQRRLGDELGITEPLELLDKGTICYNLAVTPGNLIEHEVTTVFTCTYDGEVKPNPLEVANTQWVKLETFVQNYKQHPEIFSIWLGYVFKQAYGITL